ncbi:MAG: hypothetical protein ABF743_04615 [Schleiferilactobacillus perolens]|jgi:hypothetical protein|uniref:hypothetical protein n=1 Tax=Schleiferilactobacillus perolens TaxID=100468 RepID=UPI0039E98026
MVLLQKYVLEPTWINPALIETIEQSSEDSHIWVARMASGKMEQMSDMELAQITGEKSQA